MALAFGSVTVTLRSTASRHPLASSSAAAIHRRADTGQSSQRALCASCAAVARHQLGGSDECLSYGTIVTASISRSLEVPMSRRRKVLEHRPDRRARAAPRRARRWLALAAPVAAAGQRHGRRGRPERRRSRSFATTAASPTSTRPPITTPSSRSATSTRRTGCGRWRCNGASARDAVRGAGRSARSRRTSSCARSGRVPGGAGRVGQR